MITEMSAQCVFAATLAGCYTPAIPTGAPCTVDSDCPRDQVCDPGLASCQLTCQTCDRDGGPPDVPPGVGCWAAWHDGTVAFDTPVVVPAFAGTVTFDPSITADDLTLFVVRNSSNSGPDILRSTRMSPQLDFGTPQVVTELQSGADDTRISLTADGKVAVLASSRMGTEGGIDLWQTALTAQGTFTNPTSAPLALLNDLANQFDPELSPDGLHLYYAPQQNGAQQILVASRDSPDAAFGPPMLVALGGVFTNIADPAISPDERVIVFAGEQNGKLDDLFYATRASVDVDFDPPIPVPTVSSTAADNDTEISSDGCTLYFASNRDMVRNVYVARVKR